MKDDAGYNFLNVTKYPTDQQPDAALGIAAPEFVSSPKDGAAIVSLPDPADISVPPLDLRDAVASRRSIRAFSREPISLSALSYLLWASAGVTGEDIMYRAVPSAGALHPVDTYLAVQQVEGLSVGIWRYHPELHALERVTAGPAPVAALGRACMMQPAVLRAPVVFFWAATPYRTVWTPSGSTAFAVTATSSLTRATSARTATLPQNSAALVSVLWARSMTTTQPPP